MTKIDEAVKTRFTNDKQRFITNMIYTVNYFLGMVTEYLKPYDISIPQYNILRILRGANQPVTMNSIKELMIDKAPNATRLADKLINKGLVERRRSDTDRRVVYLALTEAGRELLKTLDEDTSGEHQKFIERIPEKEAKMFSDFLDELRC